MEVVEAHRKYLGFDGPYVFSKLMRPLVKLWRSKGLKAEMYLDNGICTVKGKILLLLYLPPRLHNKERENTHTHTHTHTHTKHFQPSPSE